MWQIECVYTMKATWSNVFLTTSWNGKIWTRSLATPLTSLWLWFCFGSKIPIKYSKCHLPHRTECSGSAPDSDATSTSQCRQYSFNRRKNNCYILITIDKFLLYKHVYLNQNMWFVTTEWVLSTCFIRGNLKRRFLFTCIVFRHLPKSNNI